MLGFISLATSGELTIMLWAVLELGMWNAFLVSWWLHTSAITRWLFSERLRV